MPYRKRPYKKKPITRKRRTYNKKKLPLTRTLKPIQRLTGTSRMPIHTYQRCFDGADLVLSVGTQTAAGFWHHLLYTDLNTIPGITNLKTMYRFIRLKRVTCQYRPAKRSDEFTKDFPYPTGATPQGWYTAGGGTLEMKQLAYSGYMATPTDWSQVLNVAGKMKLLASTAPFRRTVTPVVKQELSTASSGPPATYPQRTIRSPWLSTEIVNNLSEIHYLGADCFHTLNNISYDNAAPMVINRRYVYTVECKGLKI